MTLQQLRYFLAAAEHGSFSRGRGVAADGPAEPLRPDPPARGRARRPAVRARRPAARADRGRPDAAARGRAHAAPRPRRPRSPSARSATLTGGTASFGTFGSAHHYLLGGLVAGLPPPLPDGPRPRRRAELRRGRRRRPRRARSRPGLIALPVDDHGLEVRPSIREENHYVSADPQRAAQPMTIEELAAAPLILYDARWGAGRPDAPPARRARPAGGRAARARHRGRVPDGGARPRRARARRHDRRPGRARRRAASRAACTSVSLDPPLYDTFAFVTRRNAHLSPATRAFMDLAQQRIDAMGSGS